MIILSKRRLLIILEIILVVIFTFTFKIAKNEDVIQTVSTPTSNKTIVLDAGHRKAR